MGKNLPFSTRFFAAWQLVLGLCATLVATPFNPVEAQLPFIITVKTDNPGASNGSSFTISTDGVSPYHYEVDWDNDGVYDDTGVTGDITHDYGTEGTYTLRIRGTFPHIYFGFGGDALKVLDVNQWGDNAWESMEFAFAFCENLTISATDLPNLSNVTNMSFMFFGCYALNGPANIGSWDISNVQNLSGMFFNCIAFNQPIGDWDMSSVTDMSYFLAACGAFDQPVNNWNTSNVTNMGGVFAGATIFNQPVNNWNTANVTNMEGVFNYATAFNQPIGNWNTSNVNSMYGLFWGATAFNQPIGDWDVSNVNNDYGMFAMFFEAASFNQPLGNWDVSNVKNMFWMFNGAAAFNQPLGNWTLHPDVVMDEMLDNNGMDCVNYSATLNGWANNPATPSGRSLGASGRQYGTNVAAARAVLTGTNGWTINGDAPSGGACGLPTQPNEFIITVKTDNPGASNSTSFTIPTTGGGYHYEVDWNNDGLYDQSGITGDVTHDYGTADTYTLRIRGAFPHIYFNFSGDRLKLLDVAQWGSNAWASMRSAFKGCSNMNITATDVPDLSGVTDMSEMFRECHVLNNPANIGDWNTAAVTNMRGLFWGAHKFNQPIGDWNTAAVTNMENMFFTAVVFNQPIGDWNTAAVTNMGGMFAITDSFNQPIGNWNTAAVTNMGSMFWAAKSFNQPIGNWNTAAVTAMGGMFNGAGSFNQPVGDWNTAAVTTMGLMFQSAGSFNQPVGDWNTAAVTSMFGMFNNASSFNQPIGNWSTAKVTGGGMISMFSNALAFNQPIGTWTLNANVNMDNMLNNCGMDCANYSATLNGWANNPATPSGRSLSASGRQYGTNASAARTALTTTKSWTINGDNGSSVACTCTAPQFTACPNSPIVVSAGSQCQTVVYYNAVATGVSTPTLGHLFVGATTANANGTGSGATFGKGTTTVTVKATNACGTAQCVFSVQVLDTQAPTITCPANIVRGTDPGICGAVVNYAHPTYSDNCPGAGLDHISGGLSGSTFPRGTTTVRWMATDASNNTKTCTFRITVNDTQAPTIVCPSVAAQHTAPGQCSATVSYPAPTASDNCTASPTVTRIGGPASGSIFPVGSTAVTWRAIDGAGRSSTCSFAISVADNQAPSITCPGNIVQNNPANACNTPVFYNNPTATDNCGVNSVYLVSGLATGSSFPVGTTVVTWQANDANGLSATCSFVVTVTCGAARPTPSAENRGTQQAQNDTWDFTLAPNPTRDAVQIAWALDTEAPAQLTVLDAQGRLVWAQQISPGTQTLRLDVADWAAGLYLVALRGDGQVVVKKLAVGR